MNTYKKRINININQSKKKCFPKISNVQIKEFSSLISKKFYIGT